LNTTKEYQEAYDSYIKARDVLWEIRDNLTKESSKIKEAKVFIRKLIGKIDATNK